MEKDEDKRKAIEEYLAEQQKAEENNDKTDTDNKE